MKLEEIHSEVLNEAIKGPLAAFEFALRAAGKGVGEANGALLSAVQKINPSVRQLTRATDEEISKALLRVEFKEYRQIIAKSIIANKEREIELILRVSDLTTTQGIKQAKANIANRLGIKNAFANDVVNLKIPKTPRVTPLTQNIDELWSFFGDEMKNFGLLKKFRPTDRKLFILEVRSAVQKEIAKISPKFEIHLNNLKKSYDRLSPTEQKEMLVKVRDNMKKLGEEKNLSQKIINRLNDGIVDFLRNIKDSKYTSMVIIGSTTISGALDLVRASGEDGPFKGPLGADGYTTFGVKAAAQYIGKVIVSLNPYALFIYIGLTLDSIVRYAIFIKNKKNDKTNVQKTKEYIKNKADTLIKKISPKLDSLNQEYQPKVDSLTQTLKNKISPNKPNQLDSAGKEQIIDPFKQ
jgi:hypothetical protein